MASNRTLNMNNIIIPFSSTPLESIVNETKNNSQYIKEVFEDISSFIEMLNKLKAKYSKEIFFSKSYYNVYELINVSFSKSPEYTYLKTNHFRFTENKKECVLFFNDDYDDENCTCFIKNKENNDIYLINQKSIFGSQYYNIKSINIIKNDKKVYSCGKFENALFFLKADIDFSKTKYILGSNWTIDNKVLLSDTKNINKKNVNIKMVKAVYFEGKKGFQFKLKNSQYEFVTIVDKEIVELQINKKVFNLIEKSEQLKKNKLVDIKEKYSIIKYPKEKELKLFNERIQQALDFNLLVNDSNRIQIKSFNEIIAQCLKNENNSLITISSEVASNILEIKNKFIFEEKIKIAKDDEFPEIDFFVFEDDLKVDNKVVYSDIAENIHSTLFNILENQ